MKKYFFYIFILMLVLVSTSCNTRGNEMLFRGDNIESIADNTFTNIINALNEKDEKKIVDLFSDAIQDKNDLTQSSLNFIAYIKGDISSFSSASEAGVGADYVRESGKLKTDIQSSFCVTTTQNVYYIAVKECIKNESANTDIGLLSIYVIEKDNWNEDYIYRGDGSWTPGINIDYGDSTVIEIEITQ